MKKDVVIIGAGGFAREVLDVLEACNRKTPSYNILGYIVDAQYGVKGTMVNDRPILGHFDWLRKCAHNVFAIGGVGTTPLRRRLVLRAKEAGCRFCTVVHPTAVITRWIEMGEGVVITAGCILTNRIRLANHVHVNLGCTIGHDAIIEEYVTLAPGVHVSGGVTLEEGSYIGTGANLLEGIRIGAWSIIGAGSTIVKDVPPNTTVVGVPGKVIKQRDVGWHLEENPDVQ